MAVTSKWYEQVLNRKQGIVDRTEKINKPAFFRSAPNYRQLYETNQNKNKDSFRRSGILLAEIEDSSDYGPYEPLYGSLVKYCDLTLLQLKSYITWRTIARKGTLKPIDNSYVFLYAFELINLIGVESKNEAFDRLMFIWQDSIQSNARIVPYLEKWIPDFIKHYGLSVDKIENLVFKKMLKDKPSIFKSKPEEFKNALSSGDYVKVNEDMCSSGYDYSRGTFALAFGNNVSKSILIHLIRELHIQNPALFDQATIEKHDNYFEGAVFEQPWKGNSYLVLNETYLEKLGKTIELALDTEFHLSALDISSTQILLDKKSIDLMREIIRKYVDYSGWKTLATEEKPIMRANHVEVARPVITETIQPVTSRPQNNIEIDLGKLDHIRESATKFTEQFEPDRIDESIPSAGKPKNNFEIDLVKLDQARQAVYKALAEYVIEGADENTPATRIFEEDVKVDKSAQSLTLYQIKSYITWRTRVKKGKVEAIDVLQVFLYACEIINFIDIENKDELFDRLLLIWENSMKCNAGIATHLEEWAYYFIKHYGSSTDKIGNPFFTKTLHEQQSIFMNNPEEFENALRTRDYTKVNEIVPSNGYDYNKDTFALDLRSPTPEQTLRHLVRVIQTQNPKLINLTTIERPINYLEEGIFVEPWRGKSYLSLNSSFLEKLGETVVMALDRKCRITPTVNMTSKCLIGKHNVDFIIEIIKKYLDYNGWMAISPAPKDEVVKAARNKPEAAINQPIINKDKVVLGTRHSIAPGTKSNTNESQKSIVIEINIEKLTQIRQIADETTEKLIPEDLYSEYMSDEDSKEEVVTTLIIEGELSNEWEQLLASLNNNSHAILKLIMQDSSYNNALKYATANNLMIEEEIERINEVAIEVIGDTLVEYDGTEINVIEDYKDEVNKIIWN